MHFLLQNSSLHAGYFCANTDYFQWGGAFFCVASPWSIIGLPIYVKEFAVIHWEISLKVCVEVLRDDIFMTSRNRWFAGRAAASKSQALGLSPGNPRLQFAQRKGVADVLSILLTHAGFQVNKMLLFETVPEFIPYIVRRAVENRGLL